MTARTTTLSLLALAIALALPCAVAGADPTTLLDSFEDGTVGLAPADPETGSSYYTADGAFVVEGSSAAKHLRATSTAPGYLFARWSTVDTTSDSARLTYRVTIDPTSTFGTANALLTTARLSGGSFTLPLYWLQDHRFLLKGSTVGSFVPGTEYRILWDFDFQADTFSLVINGARVAGAQGMGFDATGLSDLELLSNSVNPFVSLVVDDVRAVEDPVFASGFDIGSPGDWSAWSPAMLPGDECTIPGLLGQGIETPGTLAGHSGGSGDDTSCGSGDTIDRWILYTAQCTGQATISTCLPGTEFDTVLSAFDACGGAQLACNDDATGAPAECQLDGSNRKSEIAFAATAGSTYAVRVSVYGDAFPAPDATEFEVRADCEPAP